MELWNFLTTSPSNGAKIIYYLDKIRIFLRIFGSFDRGPTIFLQFEDTNCLNSVLIFRRYLSTFVSCYSQDYCRILRLAYENESPDDMTGL